MDKGDGSAEQWLADFTTAIRSQLPQGQYILTHAPVAPWYVDWRTLPVEVGIDRRHLCRFSVNDAFKGGAYLKVDQTVGDSIDWVSVLQRCSCS